MARGLQVWSQTAASNNTADSGVNWAEGQAPSSVNDSARAEMASMAMWRDDNNGTIATTGTTLAYTATTNQIAGALTNGYTVTLKFHATNDSSATFAPDGLAAKQLQLVAGTNLAGGEFVTGSIARFTYISASTAWVLNGHEANGSQANIVNTTNITNNAVTLAKLATQADQTVLANVSGGTAVPTAVPIGTGLVVTSGNLTAPAFPPTAAFKNLAIKVTGNTAATIAADFVTLATSGSSSFITLPVSSTMNFGTTGADALDASTLASGTPYAAYAIATTTSTAAHGLASTSFTTPAMPGSYVYKARIGSFITSTSTASAVLMGTWQLGRRAQYVVGLAGTSGLVTGTCLLSTGATGDTTTPTYTTVSTTKAIPSTASKIAAGVYLGSNSSLCSVAPNGSYGAHNSATNPPPYVFVNNSGNVPTCFNTEMLLESTNIYWATNGLDKLFVLGWEDNI